MSSREKVRLGLFLVFCGMSFAREVQGAAKPAPVMNSCSTPPSSSTVANPVRPVVLKPVGVQSFQLPNGRSVNFQADLQSMLNTAVTNDSNFAPVESTAPSSTDPCQSHLELRSTVSTFQLDAVQFGVSIGFNPQGSIPLLQGITGKTQMNVGNISMDFGVLSCSQGTCTSVAASSANHTAFSGSLSLSLDFGAISTGPELLINTPLGDILRKIIHDGIAQLGQSSHLNEIPWEAHVREYIPQTKMVVFDAGNQARLKENQEFEIYIPPAGHAFGACGVYQILAYAHTIAVNATSSVAVLDWSLGSRDLQSTTTGDLILPGDVVLVHVGPIP